VLPQLRRLEGMGAASEKALAEPQAIDAAARVLVAAQTTDEAA
jgi:hypothetical protein